MKTRMWHAAPAIGAAAALLTLAPTNDNNNDEQTTPNNANPATLDSLTVADENTADDYDRDDWGYGDTLHGKCTARHLMLKHDAIGPVDTSSGSSCAPNHGQWVEYYTGKTVTNPKEIEGEHVLPLKEVNRSGGADWSTEKKEAFANGWDSKRLVPADKSLNRSHSDQDPSDWLPPERQCSYLVDWIDIKSEWGLTVDQDEHDALARGLDTYC